MRVRLLRGQVVVRELPAAESPIWTPKLDPYTEKTHRGVVLGMGPPALVHGKFEVPHEFEVGDVVQFHFTHLQDGFTRPWPEDGDMATWLPQQNVDAVIEL